jgi:AraC-like DNA-binding protein
MMHTSNKREDIERLNYRPRAHYPYDLEIFRVSDLKQRTREERMRVTYRYEFHMLICVTHGKCVQWVDFEPVSCKPGTLLALQPGQAHNFGHDENWDGWMVLFRPEFLLPTLSHSSDLKLVFNFKRLPNVLNLESDELRRALDSIVQMSKDSMIDAPSEDVHTLLRYQLYVLVTWLGVIHDRRRVYDTSHSHALLRFTRFQKLVEEHFAEWSHVSEYAISLGCTERSLTRATTTAVGVSAKSFISARINLEAKRLLVHTDFPLCIIAEKLGFEEATHFSKFFKRETGCTPTEFRQRQGLPQQTFRT